MTDQSTRVGGNRPRISDETKQRVLSASVDISNCELARQLGISEPSVRTTRIKAGIVSAATRGKHVIAKLPSPKAVVAAVIKTGPIRIEVPAAAKFGSGQAVPPAEETISIAIEIAPSQMDTIWNGLSSAAKANALRGAFFEALK